MKRAISLSIIITLIGLLFFFTKPTDDYLMEKAFEHVRTELNPSVALPETEQTIFFNLFKRKLSVKDNFFYKTVYFETGDNKVVAGFGFLTTFMSSKIKR